MFPVTTSQSKPDGVEFRLVGVDMESEVAAWDHVAWQVLDINPKFIFPAATGSNA